MNINQYRALLSNTKENEIELLSLFRSLEKNYLLLVIESM